MSSGPWLRIWVRKLQVHPQLMPDIHFIIPNTNPKKLLFPLLVLIFHIL